MARDWLSKYDTGSVLLINLAKEGIHFMRIANENAMTILKIAIKLSTLISKVSCLQGFACCKAEFSL